MLQRLGSTQRIVRHSSRQRIITKLRLSHGYSVRGMNHDFPFIKSSTAMKAGIPLGDVRFFRIASMEVVKNQQFYGMSVADHHNLLANGIVVKNCYQEQIMRILNRLGGIELAKCVCLHQGDQQEEARDHRRPQGRLRQGGQRAGRDGREGARRSSS